MHTTHRNFVQKQKVINVFVQLFSSKGLNKIILCKSETLTFSVSLSDSHTQTQTQACAHSNLYKADKAYTNEYIIFTRIKKKQQQKITEPLIRNYTELCLPINKNKNHWGKRSSTKYNNP